MGRKQWFYRLQRLTNTHAGTLMKHLKSIVPILLYSFRAFRIKVFLYVIKCVKFSMKASDVGEIQSMRKTMIMEYRHTRI